jgi:quinol monooxygenase YgiN
MTYKYILPVLTLACIGCGPSPTTTVEPPVMQIDDTKCTRGALEADGLISSPPIRLDSGTYVISTTYLQIKPTKEAGRRFSEVNAPLEAELKSNPGLIQATTLVSQACNTARTLSAWKDEAAMMRFVSSPAHLAAISAIADISRGGSIVTHYTDDGSGFNWAAAAVKLQEDTGPFY